MRPRASWGRVVLAVWQLVPAGCSLALAYRARVKWWPGDRDEEPLLGDSHQLSLQLMVAIAAACLATLAVLIALGLAWRVRRGSIDVAASFALVVASASPIGVRSILPPEDPYDGTGSPLAVMIGRVMMTAFFGLLFTLPAAISLYRRLQDAEEPFRPGELELQRD